MTCPSSVTCLREKRQSARSSRSPKACPIHARDLPQPAQVPCVTAGPIFVCAAKVVETKARQTTTSENAVLIENRFRSPVGTWWCAGEVRLEVSRDAAKTSAPSEFVRMGDHKRSPVFAH